MERRHTRRLVRYWVFLAIAYLFGLGAYLYYSGIHATLSSVSASIGMIGPRYLMNVIGLYYLAIFVLGIVFLAFDVRARDVRENIVEVLDARPLTNFELVTGRFVAFLMSSWIPAVVLVLIIEGLGFLLPLLGSPVGETIEPLSLIYFAIFMAVPALAFVIGFVFVVTLLVRHRLVAAGITLGALVGLIVAAFASTPAVTPYLDFMGFTQAVLPSDIVPAMFWPGGLQQRVGVLLVGLGLLGIAAAIHPRLDAASRSRPLAAAAALCLAGALSLVLVAQMRQSAIDLIAEWRAAHEARAAEPVADVVAIDGTIRIAPGESLAAELEIEVAAPPDAALRTALFTLNPGLEVAEVSAAGGRALEYEQADGLLAIALPAALGPGARTTLRLRYAGRPDPRFGYLDSTLELESLDVNEAQIALLGTDVGIFDGAYAALTPGLRWLPASGVDVGRDDSRTRRPDFFRAALDLEVPADWLAAGPGKRIEVASTAGRKTFRFAPDVELPEVALMAGALESYATEIDGVTFEALVHPKHTRNFTVLAEARGEVEQWIADRLEAAREAGLPYPFDAFTVVEVPNTLRSYEGGWRLDTALAPPAMALMREPSFPTARFDFDVVALAGGRNFEQEGGKPRIDRDRLVSFFVNDLSGGNVFAAAARSFFTHRIAARGRDALALDYMLEELSTLLVSGRRSYFSAHLFTDLNQAVTSVLNSLQGLNAISDSVIRSRGLQPEVWDSMLDVSLSELDPRADPQRAIDTLSLKAGQLAQVLRDTLGDAAVGDLLRRLLERHAGGSFTLEDFVAVSRNVSPELEPIVANWLASTGLPGFVVRGVEQYRLPADENGDNRYQLVVRLSNDEPVTGFARVEWAVLAPGGGGAAFGRPAAARGGGPGTAQQTVATSASDPIRIEGQSAVEFGAVLRRPVTMVRILPYLSLNRAEWVAADFPRGREPPIRAAEPLDGVRAFVVAPSDDERILADDLDEGFSIVDEGGDHMRLAGRFEAAASLDNGLPTAVTVLPNVWSRRGNGTAWGRYRHTFTYIAAGDGETRAVMPVSIPRAGRWELEIHLPQFNDIDRGTWNLEIVSANGREPVTFNAAIGNVGWNVVGEFDLPAGEVSVELRDDTTGRLAIADAIAWSPARTRTAAAAADDNYNGNGD